MPGGGGRVAARGVAPKARSEPAGAKPPRGGGFYYRRLKEKATGDTGAAPQTAENALKINDLAHFFGVSAGVVMRGQPAIFELSA